jgi:hypothetical protein
LFRAILSLDHRTTSRFGARRDLHRGHQITLPGRRLPDRVAIEAKARVSRYAFGVTSMKGVAARDIDIHLTIVAVAV